MIIPLLFGALLVGAVIVAGAKHFMAERGGNRPIGLDVKPTSKPGCNCL